MKGRRTVDPETGLTANMEAFCVELVKTDNPSAAYRKTYSAERMSAESVSRCAAELLVNPRITTRLAQLRSEARKASVLTLEDHMRDLRTLRNAAASASQYGAAISAEVARGKVAGLYEKADEAGEVPAPVKVEISVVDGRRQE